MNEKENEVQITSSVVPYQSQHLMQFTPKEYKPLDKKDVLFALFLLLSSFLIVDFALFNGFATGFFIAYTIFFIITTLYIHKKAEKISIFSWLCGVLSVIGSFYFVLFNDELMKFFMIILMGILFSTYCIGISSGFGNNSGSFRMLIGVVKSVVLNPFSNIGEIYGSARASAKEYKKSFGAIIGFVVALPVLCVIIPLLVKSDAAFEGLVMNVIKNIGKYLLEIAIAIIILCYFYPFAFGHRHSTAEEKKLNRVKKCFPSSACISFLSVISLVYIIYLFSQLAYFFSAFEGILPADYEHTASAFARRGFYEMFAVCVINIAIVSVVSMLIKKRVIAVKLLSTFISLFSVLLIIVAMGKMKLNISIFGLSENRVLVSVFMIMVLFVTILFIVHIFAPKVPYMKAIIIFCSTLFIAVSFANIDALVVKYNINAYNSKSIASLDVEHMGDMSDSAVPSLVELCKSEDHKISSTAKRKLMERLYYNYNCFTADYSKATLSYSKNHDFRAFNYTEQKACRAIMDYYNSLTPEEQKNLLTYHKHLKSGYYDENEDIFYDYNSNNDGGYKYDKKTGAYTIKATATINEEA